MTVRNKIKKIRTFRGMTQKVGLASRLRKRERTTGSPSMRRITVFRNGNCWTRWPRRCPEVDRQNFHHRPRLCRGLHADILLAGRGQPWRYPACSSLSAIRAEQGPLMIPLYGTMIAMTGPHTLPWVCTSSMALWTSSCGNGFFVSRSYTPGRSPGKSILNGNSTGPIPATMAWKANIISLGGKIK